MNKSELAVRLAEAKQMTKVQSDDIVNTVFNIIKEALKYEHKVCIKDFGTFQVKARKGRMLKDISTNKYIEIPDMLELKLKVAPAIKNYLNNKE